MRLTTTTRRLIFQILRGSESRWLAHLWLFLIARAKVLPGALSRRVTDEIQPSRPIRQAERLPAVQIVIACSPKDFEILPATVELSLLNVENPVESIAVVVPDSRSGDIQGVNKCAELISEGVLVPPELMDAVRSHHPPGRFGWVLQQVIGLYAAWSSEAPGVLVLDSDTLLTRRRVFLQPDKRQMLSFSHEYHRPYEEHASRVWGPRTKHHGLSYVTHHQLMQPWVLREMFPRERDLAKWVLAGERNQRSPLADYHSYGRWLTENHAHLASFARWGNKSISRRSIVSLDPRTVEQEIRSRFPKYFSVSLHSYIS